MTSDSKYLRASPDIVLGPQIRAARALLDWSIPVAAEKCGVGRNTLSRLEKGERSPGIAIMRDIVDAFEQHGVIFIDTDVGTGVLLNDRIGTVAGPLKRRALRSPPTISEA